MGYDQNKLLDNSEAQFRLLTCLHELLSNPDCTRLRIATGYWDLPGTNLLYEPLKQFLEERNGTLELLIGEEPHLSGNQLSALPEGQPFPDFFIKKDFELLTDEFRPVAQLLLDYVRFDGGSDEGSQIKIHVYGKEEGKHQFLHAKCYILTGSGESGFARGIIGSSNFTAKGLGGADESCKDGNSELNYLETNVACIWESLPSSPARTHVDWFLEKWENSRPWNGRFITLIKSSAIGKKLLDRNVCESWVPSTPLTPYEVYIKLLQHRYGMIVDVQTASEISSYLPPDMLPLDYQIDAVKQCFAAMRNRGGFLLADVVGMGKTIIAALVIRRFLDCPDDRSPKILVVMPPAVKSSWTDTLQQFHVPPGAVDFVTTGSIGNLVEDGEDDSTDTGDFEEGLQNENYGLIIIDESHKFRNANTAMWKSLDELIHRTIDETAFCPYVGLLSATPQNNSPSDIKNQIYLFARDHKHSAFDGVPNGGNLETYFAKTEDEYRNLRHAAEELLSRAGGYDKEEMDYIRRQIGNLAQDIRDKVLSDILVRRTRTDVQKYYRDDIERKHLHFPAICGPNELKYIFSPRLAEVFARTMNLIAPEGEFHFQDVQYLCYFRYQAVRFLRDPANKEKYKFKNLDAERFSEQLAHIMRMLLVKRLESSFSAFRESLLNLKLYTENMVKMWEADTIFICPQINVNQEFEKSGFDIFKVQAILRKKIAKLDAEGKNEQGRNCEYRREDFDPNYIGLIQKDLELVNHLCDEWMREVNVDPKLDEFIRCLPGLMAHEHNVEHKLVIFSEAKATVALLAQVLAACGYEGRVLTITAQNRKEMEPVIKANFGANFTGERKNDYDIIVTTEVLAEGVNLHRANFILNCDAPWNATRLMQRIGRVNRIGTRADFIHVYNFMPSAEGDQCIKLVGKAYVKLQSFQSLLGEDSKIFTNAETAESHDVNNIAPDDEESAFAPYIAELKAYKTAHPERYSQIEAMPYAEAAVSSDDAAYFTVVPPQGLGLFVRVPYLDGEPRVIPLAEMLEACKVLPGTPPAEPPRNWEEMKQEAVTAYIHYQAPTTTSFRNLKIAKSAILYADRLKSDPGFQATKETKKLLNTAKQLVSNGNVDVIKKLNALGAHLYSAQMELLPFTADEINETVHESLAAVAAAHEVHKGRPRVIIGISK